MAIKCDKAFYEKIERAKELAYQQIKVNLGYFTEGFAHVSENGIYPQVENNVWTTSFYPGMTYLAYEDTKDEVFLKNRQAYLDSFKERCFNGHMVTHDIGFLFMLTYLKDYRLFGEESALEIAVKAADILMSRYHKDGGFIQAWKEVDDSQDETMIIIDTMMNVEFLFRMSEITGDDKYREAAYNHSLVTSQTIVRDDASTYHMYFLKKTGQHVKGQTHQGHQDESTWARGQSWAVYGFSRSYLLTKEEKFLDTALAVSKVYIDHLPKDKVHYWDFDFTDKNPDIRDTSAASIGAMGLLLLHNALIEAGREDEALAYKEIAAEIIDSLISNYMITEPVPGQGLLKEGMYHRNNGFNEFTSWGDYYFIEALQEILNIK